MKTAKEDIPGEVMQGLCHGHAVTVTGRTPIFVAHLCRVKGLVGALKAQRPDCSTTSLHPGNNLLLPDLEMELARSG